jgi:hypothetical protein
MSPSPRNPVAASPIRRESDQGEPQETRILNPFKHLQQVKAAKKRQNKHLIEIQQFPFQQWSEKRHLNVHHKTAVK